MMVERILLSAADGAQGDASGALSEAADSIGKATSELATKGASDPLRTLFGPILDLGDWIVHDLPGQLPGILWRLLLILLIILGGRLLLGIISRMTYARMKRNQHKARGEQNPRIDSMMTLIRSTARYVIFIMVFALCLQVVIAPFANDFNAITMIFGAFGAGAVAIGFGTQDLVKDIVNGLLLTFENQFNVGDFIKTEEVEGTVTAMALRVTYIRNVNGQQVIVPNRTIGRVSNFTRGEHTCFVTIPTPYEADTDAILRLIAQAIRRWSEKNEEVLLEPPSVLGVSAYAERSIDVTIRCKAKSMKGWDAERGIRLAVKKAFDAHGIEMPHNRMLPPPPPAQKGATPIEPSPAHANNAGEHGSRKQRSAKKVGGLVERPVWQTNGLDVENAGYDESDGNGSDSVNPE